MSQQFITQIEQVCRRRGRRRWLAASCWALASMLLSALVLVGLDRALGIADPIGRSLLTTVFVVFGVLVIRRWFFAVAANPVYPLQIAQEVEQRHPKLRDVVTSAWDFANHEGDDPTAGSESLRRAVVLHAATAVDQIDWQELIPRKPLRQAALALASVAITISLLGGLLPQAMGIGLTRLANPFSAAEWPREHDLQFVEPPTLLAAGEDLVLLLRDNRGAMPTTITMHYRTRRQGRWHEETQPLPATTNPLQIRRPNVQATLQFRATGNDHQTMPWQSLEVVAPPRIEQLQVIVHPAAYTNLPAHPWDNTTSIYAGSELELQGRTDQPVRQVVLQSEQGQHLMIQVSPDGHSFWLDKSDWCVESSDTYTLHMTTAAGLKTRAATELTLDVVVDRPPQVRFVEPTDDLTVLPTVAVPLVVAAKDEFAVQDIELVYRRSDRSDEGEQRRTLWRAVDGLASEGSAREKQVDFLWQLEELSLEPGSVFEIHARATDAQPATGQTVRALRLNVVLEDELWNQIIAQQQRVAEVLAQLLKEQRELRGVTTGWAEFPNWSIARWTSSSQASLYRQRQIADALARGQHSVLGLLADAKQTIERNQLSRPETLDHLQAAIGLLENLVDDPLTLVEASLSGLARQSRRSLDQESLKPLIDTTGDRQEEVIAGLRRVIEILMPGNILGRLERDLESLESDQRALTQRCRVEIASQAFQSEDVRPDQQAALRRAVGTQRELARRLAELVLDMTRTARCLADNEPVLAARLAETVTLAEELGAQAAIQAAAEQLARRRLGRSATLQKQTIDNLAKLRARLAGQDAAGAAKRVERLRAVERQLQRLRREVAALEQELRQLSPEQRQRELERLRRQREELAKQSEAMTRQLERLRIPKASEATKAAATRLRRSKLDTETTKQARQQLDAAQRQLTAARRRQQVALARLEMAKLDAKLGSLLSRQQTIQQEIIRLEELRKTSGQLSSAQTQSVLQLALLQAGLREEVVAQADQLTSLPVFAHLLKMAGVTMQSVEDQLQQTELGQPTQFLADQVVRQLTRLTEAVRQERKNQSTSNQDSGGCGEGQSGDKAQEQTLQLALGQLKLLKSLQTDLREKTQTLETQLATNQPPTHSANELARQQQQLTELARQLVPEPPDPPTEELFPNLEQELERSLDDISLPRAFEENQP